MDVHVRLAALLAKVWGDLLYISVRLAAPNRVAVLLPPCRNFRCNGPARRFERRLPPTSGALRLPTGRPGCAMMHPSGSMRPLPCFHMPMEGRRTSTAGPVPPGVDLPITPLAEFSDCLGSRSRVPAQSMTTCFVSWQTGSGPQMVRAGPHNAPVHACRHGMHACVHC